MGNDKKNALGYKIGFMFGIVVSLCLTAVVIGLTAKFLFWLF